MDICIEICIDYHKVQFIGLHSNRCDYEKVISKQAPVVKCFTEEAKIQKKNKQQIFSEFISPARIIYRIFSNYLAAEYQFA